MKYLHTMVRVSDLEESLHFYCNCLGLKEVRRSEYPDDRFTLIFLATDEDETQASVSKSPLLELTYNWDYEKYQGGRNFGHLAFQVKNIYETCQKLMENGVVINRPPKDGHMAFIRSPDNISIEILQEGKPLAPVEPWVSMKNTGEW